MPHLVSGINSLRQPHSSPSVSVLPVHAPTTSSHSVNSPLSPSITPSLFHSLLKTYTSFTNLTHHRLSSSPRTDSKDHGWTVSSEHLVFLFLVFIPLLFLFIGSVRQIKLAICQLLGACKYRIVGRLISQR